jgi:hypothetical protein
MRPALFAILFVLVLAPAAYADAIDGDWCGGVGKHLSISGADITTPSGVKMQGDYGRHDFRYVSPEGDADRGKQIFLKLLDEETLYFYRMSDGKSREPEIWRRCEVTS